ncbi:hypothetical protein [Mesorhizobium opportunistum]|uniref:Uncharacterized protein n=1 Tax=Mesorhizobium opportunistum (strain LMG 24607 / HAMBI 3007 / WSM2075) TaxID=536019 RepID=F7YC94_MESOW|nr:hypothetical protein [Mesorhizobium opportunistum]AEH86627.1 conserved hypothetical protein [Mesorhizobium opportunistum WSM2075]
MALVSYVLGRCPGCGAEDKFGNVDVYGDHVYLGCGRCRYNERRYLPPVKKKVLYLDQFFFSHAVRGNEAQFVEAAKRIVELASLQLLVVPYSSVHEEETHQWAGHKELLEFIKSTARGYEFAPAYEVEQTQLNRAFDAWRSGEPAAYTPHRQDAFHDNLDVWDGYFRIEVGEYHGDIDLIRRLKAEAIEGLVDLFPGWRESTATFEQNVRLEHDAAAKGYLDAFGTYMTRMAKGDFDALSDSPIMATVVRSLSYRFPREEPPEGRIKKVIEFLASDHFTNTPYHDIQARMYGTLKDMVKAGAYTNRARSIQRLSGFYYDVKHISTYAPYCDAFVMDNPMAEIVNRDTVDLTGRYGTAVFSRNNWDEFLAWLDQLKNGVTDEHRSGLATAYPRLKV